MIAVGYDLSNRRSIVSVRRYSRSSCAVVRNRAGNLMFWAAKSFGGAWEGPPKLCLNLLMWVANEDHAAKFGDDRPSEIRD